MSASTLRQRAPSPSSGVNEKNAELKDASIKESLEGKQFIVPNYSVKQLLDAIPAHCFHRSTFRSSLYVVQDVILMSACVYAAFQIDPLLSKLNISPITYQAARIALYTLYTVAAGFVGTGFWIIGHECGHQAYSPSKKVNFAVGWVIHSALLVPFHSWRISHGQHHAATGHMTRDQVFVPKSRNYLGYPAAKEDDEVLGLSVSEKRQAELREALDEAPIVSLIRMVVHQLLGWPLYLFMNASGQPGYPAWTNHFNPSAIIFRPQQKPQIVWSDFGLLLVLAGLTFWGVQRSFTEVAVIYGIPYLWVNHWLVFITYLQHTDPVLPHYSAEKWTFARGALATMDRNFFGPIGPYLLHGITETHVAHHISSKIPHYNAWEATAALKKFLGVHYQQTDENMMYSFYKSHRDCIFVEDTPDVKFYKNTAGVAQRYAAEESGSNSDSGVDVAEFIDE